MFRNLRINIFIYYYFTTGSFLAILYYFLEVSPTQNLTLLSLTLVGFVSFTGVIISKLAIDPLAEHVNNLQNLSKETLHELNLPISTILTNIHLLKKSLENEKDLKRASRIESACQMLQERYNELDYMIKLQGSKIIAQEFNLNELVENRVDFLRSIYPHVEFNLNLHVSSITTDKTGLSKVIDNLIDNAVKYSQSIHKIDIILHNNTLEIKDYGCGIDEVELVHIFDNYYQSNKSIQGFGIGLSMVKRFCDSNDISLNFKSKPDEGTTVVLHFK
ncbi:HAMP domain-containing histidine kinase [Sulfurimonas sp.]|nr:HAMP domain-containing histidine kinase [Sulfurimonas sp.]